MLDTLSDLIAQREAIERQILAAQSASKTEAISKVRQLMSEHGLTAADLVAKSPSKAAGSGGKKVAPKYRDPESNATWTGRGLRPKWLQSALDSGKSLSDFAIS